MRYNVSMLIVECFFKKLCFYRVVFYIVIVFDLKFGLLNDRCSGEVCVCEEIEFMFFISI